LTAGDPLFYLHHTGMDRTWYSWQLRDPVKRKKDISGNLIYEDYTNAKGGNVTLDSLMDASYLANGKSIKIRDVMDTKGGILCYVYDSAY